jgi:hypothetical protein
LGELVLGTGPPRAARLVSLAAADVYLSGTFAFVPLTLLRIQDRRSASPR